MTKKTSRGDEKLTQKIKAVKRFVRVRKQDSAFLYAVLEAHEGLCAYSTLDAEPEAMYRDLELLVPPPLVGEVDALISHLGDWVYVIK